VLVDVYTPSASLLLAPADVKLMQGVAARCCAPDESGAANAGKFCTEM
jgi:hypothetical protein